MSLTLEHLPAFSPTGSKIKIRPLGVIPDPKILSWGARKAMIVSMGASAWVGASLVKLTGIKANDVCFLCQILCVTSLDFADV